MPIHTLDVSIQKEINRVCFNMPVLSSEQLAECAEHIRKHALDLGFHACGFAPVRPLKEERDNLDQWLAQGMHAGMQYMENNREKRLDPSLLVDGARTVICLLHNYAPEKELQGPYKIARYAYGRDYHKVLKKKMRPLLNLLVQYGSTVQRAFTDSAPVMERVWAKECGLGWIGKNSLLITPEQGSYFFLSEIFTDLELSQEVRQMRDLCGGCIRCITACPTKAIVAPGLVDARKCISYHTIENKGDIPESLEGSYSQWVFGCDICQEVCPWNNKSIFHNDGDFTPSPHLFELSKNEWEHLDTEIYARVFSGTPVDRAGLIGLKRNIEFVKKQKKQEGE